jgi:hypothetical protein
MRTRTEWQLTDQAVAHANRTLAARNFKVSANFEKQNWTSLFE